MPAFYTHYRFGNDVKKNLKLKNIDNNLYTVFNQSFDNFYFFKSLNKRYRNDIINIARIGHRNNVNNYFINIIKYMYNNNLTNDPKLRAYLYGSINHYILDSVIHPYIFYLTGIYKKDNPSSYKYNGLHSNMEFSLDAYLYKKDYSIPYYKINITNKIFLKPIFSNNLNKCIDEVFNKTFNINNVSNLYKKSILNYRFTYRYFYTDKFGIKKYILTIIDKITGNKHVNLKYHTTYYKSINKDYLNIKRNSWYHPSTNIIKNDSFYDLYSEALNKSILIINEIDKYFNNLSNIKNIKKLIGNNSYITGLDINKNKKMKYFKF